MEGGMSGVSPSLPISSVRVKRTCYGVDEFHVARSQEQARELRVCSAAGDGQADDQPRPLSTTHIAFA